MRHKNGLHQQFHLALIRAAALERHMGVHRRHRALARLHRDDTHVARLTQLELGRLLVRIA